MGSDGDTATPPFCFAREVGEKPQHEGSVCIYDVYTITLVQMLTHVLLT